MTGFGLSIVAATAIYAAYRTDEGARFVVFIALAFLSICGAVGA